MKNLATLCTAAAVLAGSASAKVSFSLDIEALTDSDGVTTISDSGLIVLVVDTGDDGFQLPSTGNIVSGNDEIVTYWDLDNYDFTSSDVTLVTEGGVDYGENWSTEDRLALFWFPDLSTANKSPSAEEVYGVFSDTIGLASGDGWTMPANGTLLHSLKLFTSAASKLVSVGDLPAAIGQAAFAVNNPPSATGPGTPSLAVTNGGGQSTLTWTASGDPSAGFIVQRRSQGGDWESIGVVDGSETSFSDADVLPGREYQYRLQSIGVLAIAASNEPSPLVSERSVFSNISSRGYADQESSIGAFKLINVGVRVAGEIDGLKQLLALGIGPYHNENNNISTWTDDIYLQYEYGGNEIAVSDDWMDDPENPGSPNPFADDIRTNHLALAGWNFFDNSKDSAILEDVPNETAGVLFRATSRGVSGNISVGLFDTDPTDQDNRIVNLSSRGYLRENGILNGGLVINGTVPKEVLAVIQGPYVRDALGAPDSVILQNPRLEVQRLGGPNGNQVILLNDDWDEQDGVADPSNGLLKVETDMSRLKRVLSDKNFLHTPKDPEDTKVLTTDAAVLVTLEPGRYIFRVYAEEDGVSRPNGSAVIALWENELD